MRSWQDYFELSKNLQPSFLLEKTIPLTSKRDFALDLGAGALKDTKFLLSMGFKHVTALDQDPAIKQYAHKIPRSSLKLVIKPFEKVHRLTANHYDLINASFSLPFTPPPFLPPLVQQIQKSLTINGLFCGQFFGPEDSWNKAKKNLTFLSPKELKTLLSPLKILYWQEKKFNGNTISGEMKHWHIFHVIAIKTTL